MVFLSVCEEMHFLVSDTGDTCWTRNCGEELKGLTAVAALSSGSYVTCDDDDNFILQS